MHPSGLYMGVIKMWAYDKKSIQKYTNWSNMKRYCFIYGCAFHRLKMSSDVLSGEKHTSRHANETTAQTNIVVSWITTYRTQPDAQIIPASEPPPLSSLFIAFLFGLFPQFVCATSIILF